MKQKNRNETWVELLRALACALIALGTCCQVMISGEVFESTTTYKWFDKIIVTCGFQLLFLCSGYLYQKERPVGGEYDHYRLVWKKLVTLGIPFLVFVGVYWLVNVAFSGDVSGQTHQLVQNLFVKPKVPYWYLYGLLLVFVISPAAQNWVMAAAWGVAALGVRVVPLIWTDVDIPEIFDVVINNWVWFVFGMILAFTQSPKILRMQKGITEIGLVLLMLFFVGSITIFVRDVKKEAVQALFGLFGTSAAVVLSIKTNFAEKTKKIVQEISVYTVPVLLMHPIFAVVAREILQMLGVTAKILYIVVSVVLSIGVPVLLGLLFKKLKWAEFILYPGKFININTTKEGTKNG